VDLTASISLALAVIVPVVVGFSISHLILPRLARRLALLQSRPVKSTVFYALRIPVLLLAGLCATYFAGVVIRLQNLKSLEDFNWSALDLWLTVSATLIAFFVLYRVLLFGVRVATVRADTGSAVLLQKLLGTVILAIAIVTALNQFDIDIAPVLASLGVAGLAVALALQDTLSNYFAGITLALDKPIRPGDYIKLEGGLEGFVQTIGWRTTHIKPFNESIIVVPNSKLANSILTNTFYPEPAVRVYVDVGVSYESDLQKVEQITRQVAIEVLKSATGADSKFEPIILFTEFADSNIQFTVILRADKFSDSGGVRSAFIKALHRTYREQQIEMNYPVRKLIGAVKTSS
jgi:small-conductance mechanosensitive channel